MTDTVAIWLILSALLISGIVIVTILLDAVGENLERRDDDR